MCVCAHVIEHVQEGEEEADNMQESVLSFWFVDPRIELRLSGLVAITFTISPTHSLISSQREFLFSKPSQYCYCPVDEAVFLARLGDPVSGTTLAL